MVHKLDYTEWFINPNVVRNEIYSMVNDTNVVIVAGDIMAAFDIPVAKGAHPDCSSHAFNQQEFWKDVKALDTPIDLKLSFKKQQLKMEYERTITIII
nr:uncharacterized protein LOC109167327 [Ipomoea batatas]